VIVTVTVTVIVAATVAVAVVAVETSAALRPLVGCIGQQDRSLAKQLRAVEPSGEP
jgi:hypothetical protein